MAGDKLQQSEPILFKFNQFLFPHFAKFISHRTSIHRQKISKLLTVEWNGEA